MLKQKLLRIASILQAYNHVTTNFVDLVKKTCIDSVEDIVYQFRMCANQADVQIRRVNTALAYSHEVDALVIVPFLKTMSLHPLILL